MSVQYRWVNWNTHKRVYDAVVIGGIVSYVVTFIVAAMALGGSSAPDPMVLAMRALGTCSLLMLHIVLAIGPLARLNPKFAPLLYNRRHLGVMTFTVGLLHFGLATLYYGAFGNRNPLLAMLAHHASYGSFVDFPFETLGFIALTILFLMAATSHDFWLVNLTPKVWKRLHMLVYVAYALLVGHVALGVLQSEPSVVYPVLLLAGVVSLTVLHVLAGLRQLRSESSVAPDASEWIDVGAPGEIPDGRAVTICPRGGDPVAVYRNGGKISAVRSVCAHQGGPLAEGKIVDGCITCPWHGYQYRPEDGQSPPPYTEKIPTYQVRIDAGRVLLHPEPLAPGTRVEPATFDADAEREGEA